MCVYGYVRVSTAQQKTKRQIDNIKTYSSNGIIYEEKQTGTNIESREVYKALLKKLKAEDTVIFDSVSRKNGKRFTAQRKNLIIKKIFINNQSMVVIAKEQDISLDRIRQIKEKGLRKLRTGRARR